MSNEWNIAGNAGAMTAVNRITGEVFSGTMASFNTRMLTAWDTTASRKATHSDLLNAISCNSASVITITIPTDAELKTGGKDVLNMFVAGTGIPVFAAGAGVTLRGTPVTVAQYGIRSAMRVGPNVWAYM
jgi:hypothetical protein